MSDAHVHVGGTVVVGAPGAERLHEVGGVVLAVLLDILLVGGLSGRVGPGTDAAEGAAVVGPLQVVLDVPVGAGVPQELRAVAVP
jgi:hypothetical protein